MAAAQALIEHIGVLCAGAAGLFLLAARFGVEPTGASRGLWLGLSFGVIGVIASLTAAEAGLGSRIAASAGPAVLAGYLAGPVGGAVAAFVAAMPALAAGDAPGADGTVAVFIYAAIGWAGARLRPARWGDRLGVTGHAALACVATVAATPLLLIEMTAADSWGAVHAEWLLLLLFTVAGVVTLGLLVEESTRLIRERDESAEMFETSRLAREAAEIGLWRYDFATDRMRWDSMQHSLMRVPAGAFGGTLDAFRNMVHPADRAGLAETFENAIARGGRYEARFRVIDGEGRTRRIRGSATFSGGSPGAPKSAIGLHIDETREFELHEQLALRGEALDSAVCGVVISTALDDQPIVYVNRAFSEITGYSPEEALGRNCRFLSDGLDNEEPRAAMRAALAAGERVSTLIRNRTKSGREFWNFVRISPIRDAAGVVTHFIGVQQDVTDAILSRDEIAEARDQLRAMLAAAPDAILTIDAEQRVTSFNAAAERLFGWPATEILGRKIDVLIPEAARAGHGESAERYIRDAKSRPGSMSGARVIDARRRDGSTFPAHVSLARFVHQGAPAITVVAHDMTDAVEAQEALRRMSLDLAEQLKAAQAANEAKSRFLAIVSHELRTPLNGTLGLTQLLLNGELDPRQRGFAESIHCCGRVLLSMIEDLLEMASSDAGKAAPHLAPTDIETVIAEAIAFTEPDAGRKGLEIVRTASEKPPIRRLTDASRLRHALGNLLSNAVKFSDEGPIEVSARTTRDGGLTIEVRDRGPGVPADRREFIFERFAQIDQGMTRKNGGLGIGLALAREMIAALGGEVGVRDAPDRGSVFWIALPPAAGASGGDGHGARRLRPVAVDADGPTKPAKIMAAAD